MPASAQPRQQQELEISRFDKPNEDEFVATPDGSTRVHLTYRVLDKDPKVAPVEKNITVPGGVSAFDAASWKIGRAHV